MSFERNGIRVKQLWPFSFLKTLSSSPQANSRHRESAPLNVKLTRPSTSFNLRFNSSKLQIATMNPILHLTLFVWSSFSHLPQSTKTHCYGPASKTVSNENHHDNIVHRLFARSTVSLPFGFSAFSFATHKAPLSDSDSHLAFNRIKSMQEQKKELSISILTCFE